MDEENRTEIPPLLTGIEPPVITVYDPSGMPVRERKPYPSVGAAMGLLGILLGASMATGAIAGLFTYFDQDLLSPALLMAYLISFGITFGLGILFRRRADFSFKAGKAVVWPLILIMTLAFVVVREPIIHLILRFIPNKGLFTTEEISSPFTIIMVVIAAPVMEEFIFRGIILDGFLKRYSPKASILLSALIFGIAHLNPIQFANGFVLGLFLGWIFWKTGSLWMCMFIHFLNNLCATLLEIYSDVNGASALRQFFDNDLYFVMMYAGSLLLCTGIGFLLWYILRDKIKPITETIP